MRAALAFPIIIAYLANAIPPSKTPASDPNISPPLPSPLSPEFTSLYLHKRDPARRFPRPRKTLVESPEIQAAREAGLQNFIQSSTGTDRDAALAVYHMGEATKARDAIQKQKSLEAAKLAYQQPTRKLRIAVRKKTRELLVEYGHPTLRNQILDTLELGA